MKNVKVLLIAFLVFLVSACSANYKFGDLSEAYCSSTSPEFRATIKSDLAANNITIGVDYCTVHGLIDAMQPSSASTNKPFNSIPSYAEGVEDIERQVNSNKLAYKESNVFAANFAKKQNQNFERMQNAS